MILVTGGTGHLGANLVRRLVSDGEEIRVLVLPGSPSAALDGLDVRQVSGDLRDPEALGPAVAGCDQIYHCAAQLSTRGGREREIYESNVLGSRNLLMAAHRAGVTRVVVTGSLSAIGHVPGRPAQEADPFFPFEKLPPYSHTKVLVEHECLKAVVDGLDVVVVASTGIVGPNDYAPSRLGGVLLKFANGKLRVYPTGGFSFVSASDLVEGHLLAMKHGRQGQKYLISTEFLTMDALLATCAQVTGSTRRPPVRVPSALVARAAGIWDPIARTILPRRPEHLTPAAIRFLRMQRQADCGKARLELGYRPTSIAHAVEAAYRCFGRRGLMEMVK